MGLRRMGSPQRRRQRSKTRLKNIARKTRERARRDARMAASLQEGAVPETPWAKSWLSEKLGKPSRVITVEDVNGLVAQWRSLTTV